MEYLIIFVAVAAVVYLGYTISRKARSDKGHGASGPRPGNSDEQ